MVPTGYESENSRRVLQICQVSLCKPCLPPHLLLPSKNDGDFAKSPDVLMWCCGRDSPTLKAAAHWVLAVAPACVFDLLFWLAVV